MNEYLDSLIEEFRAAQATAQIDKETVERLQSALDDAQRRQHVSSMALAETRARLLAAVGDKGPAHA